jgi:hypothetical protein
VVDSLGTTGQMQCAFGKCRLGFDDLEFSRLAF